MSGEMYLVYQRPAVTIVPELSHQQLTKIFESGATGDPLDEILSLATLIQPSFNPSLLRQLHHDVARLFGGSYPGFRASTSQYHDLRHTYSVALATARLLHGLSCTGRDISIQVMEQALYSAYFHDTGLLTKTSDEAGSSAVYIQRHEERSITFMARYLTLNNLPPPLIQGCSAVIECTNITLDPGDIVFPSPASKLAGYILGSADPLAQMADRYYLERLPLLFQEQREGGVETHGSAIELMENTTSFYHNIISERLTKSFADTAQAMQAHFHQRWLINDNLYHTNITRNLDHLTNILEICKAKGECLESFLKDNGACLESFLRRTPTE